MDTTLKNLTICFTTACILSYLSGCNERMDIDAEKKVIHVADSMWLQAVTDQDIDRVMSFYDDHAIWHHTDGPALQGKDTIRNRWLEFFNNQEGTLFWEPQKIQISEFENLAYSIGTGNVSYRNHNNDLRETGFDYVAI